MMKSIILQLLLLLLSSFNICSYFRWLNIYHLILEHVPKKTPNFTFIEAPTQIFSYTTLKSEAQPKQTNISSKFKLL